MPNYNFESDIPIDRDHTLEQITGRFQAVKDGLPELVKNSKDQYNRLRLQESDVRHVVVAISTDLRTILVLDFGGARSLHFQNWKMWSSREASRASEFSDIEGGHGNGGKGFMVRGSSSESYLESCIENARTRLGYDNKTAARRYKPGVAVLKGNVEVSDLHTPDVQAALNSILSEVGLSLSDLPSQARRAFELRQAYTAVVVKSIKDWSRLSPKSLDQRAAQIAEDLVLHPQADRTISTCSVWVIVDGQESVPSPLQIQQPSPLVGFENLPVIAVPSELVDPETGTVISMDGGSGSYGALQLATSAGQLRQSDRTKVKNVIRISNDRNTLAYWTLSDLVGVAESGFVYGTLTAPILGPDHTVGADRSALADTMVVRALKKWCTDQVHELVNEIRDARSSETNEGERTKASRTLGSLRELMRRFLQPDQDSEDSGDQPFGEGLEGSGGRIIRRGVEFGTKLDVIDLEPNRTSLAAAVGTRIPLRYRGLERRPDGTFLPVKGFARELRGGDGLVQLTADNHLEILGVGVVSVYLYSPDSGVASDDLLVECVSCERFDVIGPDRPVKRGEKVEIPYEHFSADGSRSDLIVETWVEPSSLGKIGRRGVFTAGDEPGDGKVFFRYGDEECVASLDVAVSEEAIERHGRGSHGNDIPLILLCGEEAPGLEDRALEDRTFSGGDDFPTIYEDPLYGSVIWVNPSSKESLKIRESRGGSTGLSGIANKTYYQFLALKCFDILKRLWVRQEVRGESINERQYVQLLAEAEMTCADFIDAGYMIAQSLAAERTG